MITVDIRADLGTINAALDSLGRNQIPFAAAMALNRTATKVRAAESDEMKRVFDKPKAFTTAMSAMSQTFATKQNLSTTVTLKPKQTRYLTPQIMGGSRDKKPFEVRIKGGIYFAQPGADAKLDAYGNITRAAIAKAFQLVASRQAFIGSPNRRGTGLYGVYATRGVKLMQLIVLVKKTTYKARYDFIRVARTTVRAVFADEMSTALRQARSRTF